MPTVSAGRFRSVLPSCYQGDGFPAPVPRPPVPIKPTRMVSDAPANTYEFPAMIVAAPIWADFLIKVLLVDAFIDSWFKYLIN